MQTTNDSLLAGKITIHQPADGYRAGLDAVFLGSAITSKPNQRILDVGCGVGTALMCALHHQPKAQGFGVDITPEFCALARRNSTENNHHESIPVSIVEGDIFTKPVPFQNEQFDHVITNPPYHELSGFTPSPHNLRSVAAGEVTNGLALWIDYCVRRLKPRGYFTMIHRADRLDAILHYLWGRVGEICVVPLFTHQKSAKRVLIRGRKDVKGGLTLTPGITIHNDDGSFTPAANRILSGEQLSF